MNTQHTPGPWARSNNVRQRDDAQRIYAGDVSIASVHYLPQKTTESFYQAHANARLIASAPDLLAALREIVDYFGPLPDVDNGLDQTLTNARAAIARATGD